MSSRDGNGNGHSQPPAPLPAPWGGEGPWAGPPAQVGTQGHTALALPPALSGGLDAAALLKGLRRHWVLAMTLGVICAGAAAALVYQLMPNKEYTAQALLRLRTSTATMLGEEVRVATNPNEFRVLQKTHETLIKSSAVLPAVDKLVALKPPLKTIRALQGRSDIDPVTWLGQNLLVSFEGEVMIVSLSGERPGDVRDIVNTVVDSYMQNIVNAEYTERSTKLEKLELQLKKYNEDLKEARKERDALANKAGGNKEAIEAQHTANLTLLARVQGEILTSRGELKKAQIELEMAHQQQHPMAAPDRNSAANRIETLIASDATIQAIDDEIKTTNDKIAAASRPLKNPKSDAYVRGQYNQLTSLQKERETRANEIRTAANSPAATLAAATVAAGGGQEAIAEITKRVQFYSSFIKELQTQEAEFAKVTSKGVQAGSEMASYDDAIAFLEKTVGTVNEHASRLKVERDAPARVTKTADAETPRQPDSKKRLLASAGAGVGTFGLVLLGIAFLEYRIRRVDSADAVARGLGMRFVGALPATPSRSRFALPGRQGAALQEAYWRSRLNESVNAIRALMLRQSQTERLQVVMVTSASVGEGKTSLSCHLATSLARAGRRTLLLDCDLRNPTAHRVFDLPLEPGMCEVLRGQVPLEEISHPIALGDLRMITAGRCDLQALHALGMEQIGEVIGRLRQQYDFIIVDTPPVLPVADPLLIGQHVDAALFSILRDVSRVPKVHTACERLAALGVRVLGAVVAGTPLDTSGSEYYYTAAYVNSDGHGHNGQESA